MITTKTVYEVPDIFKPFIDDMGIANIPFGIWCTDNNEVRNMLMEEAWKHSTRISGKIVDESIGNYIIFAFLDSANYAYETDKYIEITWDELIAECEKVEMITCE